MFYHEPGGFDPGAYERNKKAKQVLVERRKAHGTLVYCSEEPVGWCQFGPKEELTRVDRKKGYSQTSPRPWRVTCFFIAPGHRRQGMAEFALRETIRALKKLGVKDVEAYPVEGKVTASSLWSGTPGLFEAEGFQRVAPLGKKSWVYSLRLDHQ
jgi:GNAT superfamily N-acetyltransferase